MPPKTRIGKEEIADAAFGLIRKKGQAALTAKSLAAELKCSTQPVFWHFENMDEVKDCALKRAEDYFAEYLKKETSADNPYKSIGLNYIAFATEEKRLFRLLYMSDKGGKPDIMQWDGNRPFILGVMEKSGIKGDEAREKIFREMWLFSHGIATMIATDTAFFGKDEIDGMLSDVYQGLVLKLKNDN